MGRWHLQVSHGGLDLVGETSERVEPYPDQLESSIPRVA